MTIQDAKIFLACNAKTEELSEFNSWLCAEIKRRRSILALQTISTIQVGDKVRIIDTIKPARFAGKIGTVKTIGTKKVGVSLSANQGFNVYGTLNVPANCLTVVSQ